MKLEFMPSIIVGLGALAVITNDVIAIDVVQVNSFATSVTCAGNPTRIGYKGVVNDCTIIPGGSVKYTCSGSERYVSSDCTGTKEVEQFSGECELEGPGRSELVGCESYQDNTVGKFRIGASCTGGGEVSDVFGDFFFVTGVCEPKDDQSLLYKIKDDGVQITVFSQRLDCTGPSSTVTFPLGQCQLVTELPGTTKIGDETAIQIFAAVTGETLDNPSPTSSPTSHAIARASRSVASVIAAVVVIGMSVMF